jgi:hypothetical protein
MTQEALVQIIFVLCNGAVSGGASSVDDAREARIACFEQYTNCAVGSSGRILDLKAFKNKCIRKEFLGDK